MTTTTVDLDAPVADVPHADVRSAAPYRLRDLPRGGWVIAALLVVLLAVPWVSSYVDARNAGYQLSNDEALIELRVRDVFNGNPPLIGQPSTAGQYSADNRPSHPGPIEFYLLTLPNFLFGADAGALIGAAIFSLGAVLTAAWVIFRRAGPWVGLAGAVILSAIAWSEGPIVLTDIISSNVGGIPLLGLAALAWAVLDGDIRLLPLAAFFFAFVAQAHLAILALGLGVGLWVVVGAVRYVIRWRWQHASLATAGPPDGAASDSPRHWTRWRWSERLAAIVDDARPPRDRPLPWILTALAVSVLSWLPVIIDMLIHRGGNVRRIAGFGGDARETLGIGSGITQLLRAVGFPPLLTRTNLDGSDIGADLGPVAMLIGVLALAGLVAIVVWSWRRRPALATLALTTLVVGALGVVNGSQVPTSVEQYRINFYRWTFVVSAFTWLCLGWAAWILITARRPAVRRVRHVSIAYGAVAVVAAVSLLAVAASGPHNRRDRQLFGMERAATRAVLPAIEGKKRVLLIPEGTSAILAAGPALALDLEQNGHEILITEDHAGGYGDHRVIDDKEFDVAISYRSAVAGGLSDAPGKVVFEHDLNAARRSAITELADSVRGKPIEIAPDGPEILESMSPNELARDMSGAAVTQLPTNPEAVLTNPPLLALIEAGYLSSPTFDPELLQEVLDLPAPTNSWGNEIHEIRVLTPEEAREAFPDLNLSS